MASALRLPLSWGAAGGAFPRRVPKTALRAAAAAAAGASPPPRAVGWGFEGLGRPLPPPPPPYGQRPVPGRDSLVSSVRGCRRGQRARRAKAGRQRRGAPGALTGASLKQSALVSVVIPVGSLMPLQKQFITKLSQAAVYFWACGRTVSETSRMIQFCCVTVKLKTISLLFVVI